MSKNVEFFIKVTDNGSIKHVEADAEELGKALNSVKQEASRLNSDVINWAQTAQAIEMFQQTIGQLQGVMTSLTQTYQQQLVAETQLTTVMKQRMGVTDAEVESIKALCAAQQELGVIGDEVQLSGAQQMATFLSEKESLVTLIPAMNNLLAQQQGLNATQQDAASIGNMMGKAMQGQVDVLQRVGITFTAAQKSILQYGNESERAAILAEVIRDNVGNMNAELAATDPGKQKQLENTLGDIAERIGEIAQKAMPVVTVAANMFTVASGAMKTAASVKAMASAFDLAKTKTALLSVHEKMTAVAQNMLAASGYTAAAGTTALSVAVTALYAAATLGVTVAITGLVTWISSLASSAEDAAGEIDSLKDAEDAMSAAMSTARGEIDIEKTKLQELIKAQGDETDMVSHLNSKYGETFGYHSTAAEWYDTLVNKSKAYCMQLGYEAQAKVLASKKAAAELKMLDMEQKGTDKVVKNNVSQRFTSSGLPVLGGTTIVSTETKDSEEYARLKKEVQQLGDAFDVCMKKSKEAGIEMSKGGSSTTKSVGWQQQSYEALGKTIEKQKKKVESLAGVNDAAAKKEAALLTKMENRRKQLGIRYGLSGGQTKQRSNTTTQSKPTVTNKIDDAQQDELDTLEKINAAIEAQQTLRLKATKEQIAGIDREIGKLEELRQAIEDSSHVDVAITQIKTYRQLEEELTYYESKLQGCSETERVEVQKQINELRRLRKEWDDSLSDLDRPEDISRLKTIEDLDDAIMYYSNLQKRQSAEEIVGTQATINELQKKRDALMGLTSLPSIQENVDYLSTLDGKKLKLELEMTGLGEIQGKIHDLEKMLADTKNPLGAEERKQVMGLVDAYREYELTLKKSQADLRKAWTSIKDIGGGVEGVTEALTGNGDAWSRVTGLIDGVLQVYDGFNTVVSLIQTMTAVSSAHTVAKTVEAGAEVADGVAVAESAATAVTAATVVTAANAAETSSWSALAAARTFAAHADIPFVGTGIAAGFVATQQAIISACAIPRFANGAIAYGPTLGLFGEYAGAINNPEVVAPLDKLQKLLNVDGGGMKGKVTFRMKGRSLEGVLVKEQRIKSRG